MGSDSIKKEWTVPYGQFQEVDPQALANQRALRSRVARHYIELNFAVRVFDHEAEEIDPNIPISDGYSNEHPPMLAVGQVVGLEIS